MQEAHLVEMIFPVRRLVEDVWIFTRLSSGDVIVSSIPGGVGAKRTPPAGEYAWPWRREEALDRSRDDTVQEPRAVSTDDESLRTVQSLGLSPAIGPDLVHRYGSEYREPRPPSG